MPLLLAGTALAVLAAVAVAVVLSGGDDSAPESDGAVDLARLPDGVQEYEVSSQQHVAGPVDYDQRPPVGGDHSPVWQNCGVYDQPVPDEQAGHSLEHGAVWVTYRPDLAEPELEEVRQVVGVQDYVVVSPVDDLPSPIVASAWGRQLELDAASDGGLESFLTTFVQGPQPPEPGAPCTNGLGTPL